jgi:ABC-type iron transport system FetAB permease component
MPKNNTKPGWWRTGKVSSRLVCLGVSLGIAAALVHLLSYTLPTFNPVFVLYYVFYLFAEVLVMTILGVAVAGAVIVARLAVPEETTRKTRAIVTGIVALMTSGAMAFAFCSLVQSGNPWAVAGISGAVAGSAFATVSYRHISEA